MNAKQASSADLSPDRRTLEHRGATLAPDRIAHLRETICSLERWGRERAWVGPDPYEGLNARRAPLLRRSALGRRLLIQAVKRSPIDLRPTLGVPAAVDATTLAHVLRAAVRLDRAGMATDAVGSLRKHLMRLRCAAFSEPCWGYHFDVETRFFHYGRRTPNTIATAFAGHALLDLWEANADAEVLNVAEGVGRFFLRRVGLCRIRDAEGAFFGYFPGDETPVHNASLLAASVLARLGATGVDDGAEFADASRSAAIFALAHQRPNGSWPYAEGALGPWVDGFHTGYVLDALAEIGVASTDRDLAASIQTAVGRGLRFYRDHLVGADGTPRFFVDSTYPIDGQSAAQAIRSFALAGRSDEDALELAWQAYAYAATELRRPDGAFVFQRHRRRVDRIAYPRWVEAPMLEALTVLLESAAASSAPEAGS